MTPLYPIKTLEKCIKVKIDYGFGTTTNARNSRDAPNLVQMYKINTSED